MSASARNERAFLAIEALLAQLHPEPDAAALVRALRERFGSADALFCADSRLLEEIGLTAADALLLCRLPELARCARSGALEPRPLLNRLDRACEYQVSIALGLRVERFYLLCLDARGRLRERAMLHEGTSDRALFPLRDMLSEAIRIGADAAIISHNHPSLTLRPSEEDLRCTRDAIRALSAVGIPLLDHIIIADRRAVSLRQNGFLPAALWLDQCPGNRLLARWLDGAAE